jgi:hypothetical protein
MAFTKNQKKKALEHVTKNFLDLVADDHNIVEVVKENNFDTIVDLIVLRIDDLKLYTFTDDQGYQQTLTLGHVAIIHMFQGLIKFCTFQKTFDKYQAANWNALTEDDFDKWHLSEDGNVYSQIFVELRLHTWFGFDHLT